MFLLGVGAGLGAYLYPWLESRYLSPSHLNKIPSPSETRSASPSRLADLDRELERHRLEYRYLMEQSKEMAKTQEAINLKMLEALSASSRATSELGVQAIHSFWQRPSYDPSLIEAARGQ